MIILHGKSGFGVTQEFHICVTLVIAEWVKRCYNMLNVLLTQKISYFSTCTFSTVCDELGYIMQCCINLCAPCASLGNDDTSKVSFVSHSLVFTKPCPCPSLHTKFCLSIRPSVAGSSSQGSDPPFMSQRAGGREELFPPFHYSTIPPIFSSLRS